MANKIIFFTLQNKNTNQILFSKPFGTRRSVKKYKKTMDDWRDWQVVKMIGEPKDNSWLPNLSRVKNG